MSEQNFYITTTLPYVNAEPHIGFALEIIGADIIARYQQMVGKNVVFNTGTDEHGQKIYQEAVAANLDPQKYCDQYAAKFKDLKKLLGINFTNFIRTTNPAHKSAAQHFWNLALQNGDIYKAKYQVKYCVGCEMEKTDSELENSKCPLHPNQKLENREEENYFFRFSKYQDKLLNLYKNNPEFVQPSSKFKEITSFVKNGLKDFSISRIKSKMPWGIEVPNDPKQVMYVWFDALINYISTLGWPEDQKNFDLFWPGVQVAGKDNLRQQAAMWQAMLMSAGLPTSKKILINGFISVNNQKMSKSLGNVIHPEEMVKRYQTEATRYLLVSLGLFDKDMDVTWSRFDEKYTADLANGLGNLCSRVAKMADNIDLDYQPPKTKISQSYQQLMNHYQISAALDHIIDQIRQIDKYLSQEKPWKKNGGEKQQVLEQAIEKILSVVTQLKPFMPQTADSILDNFAGKISSMKPLFPRLS
ncbi:MAG: methionine--tRNA ligase [Patescibacteria group bacterium]|nr:methionine--tRNA ligase [Patescibacteria group bacterium]